MKTLQLTPYEKEVRRIEKEHIRQANGFTTGKHTGSKSKHRRAINVKLGTRMLKHQYKMMERQNEL